MTALAIVSYPGIEIPDRDWIEAVRTRHDPQAGRIGVHFTLVFPVQASPDEVSAEVSAVAKSAKPIPFTIRSARAVRDIMTGGAQVFLVPDEGWDEITTLHNGLYEGILSSGLRVDIPFVPHLTVAANPDIHWCESRAQELNLEGRIIRGILRTIDLVNVEGWEAHPIETFWLGTPGIRRA